MSEIVEKCKQIAIKAHSGQIRTIGDDKGKPYIIHPERIAARFDDEILQSVAWLHDVIEDTSITEGRLWGRGIPAEIVHAVVALTRRKNENYFYFILRVKKNEYARQVKIADIHDNIQSLSEGSLKDKYRFASYYLKQEAK